MQAKVGEKNGATLFAGAYIAGSFQGRQVRKDLRVGNTPLMMETM
jgi:hypothetical protein